MDKERLVENISNLPKAMSSWAFAAIGALTTVWTILPDNQKQTLVEHSFLPVWSYPIVMAVAGLICKAWPQKSLATVATPPGTTGVAMLTSEVPVGSPPDVVDPS